MAGEMRQVRLPAELCRAAEEKFSSRFGDLEQLLRYLLQEAVADEAGQMDQAEQRMIEERLKDLGYI